jgi:adenosylhomocysteine nucleosidase
LKKVALVVALPSEFNAEELVFDFPVIFSGVGKLNAAHSTSEALRLYNPELVINLGTAGAINKSPGELLEIREVVQRDMDARPLSPRGEVPFENGMHVLVSNFGEYKCGSGDSFVSEVDPWFIESGIDVIDMELFGIAYVCQKHSVPWRSVKYITDTIGSNSGDDWQRHLKLASKSLHGYLPKLI